MTESIQELLEFSTANGRVCPQPIRWNEIWEMLPDRERAGGGWRPSLPLILGAWWYASVAEKRQRLQEHLEYAAVKGILDRAGEFLRALPEDQWFHEGE